MKTEKSSPSTLYAISITKDTQTWNYVLIEQRRLYSEIAAINERQESQEPLHRSLHTIDNEESFPAQ